ncbi:MAG TPA: tetratricopeptide repeat protein [Gemmatimonadaceae bacterium]|jgi:tetratricopeptide (TPR) repeat protein
MKFFELALASAVLACGCAQAISGSATDIARLEQTRTANPKSEAAARSLGIAYFKANRFADARAALDQAAALQPNDGVVALYLGLTAEAQNDLPAARTAYESYMKVGRTNGVKRQINDRLLLLARKENEAAAQQAVAREQQLSSIPGPPNTVAVLPFTFNGADTSYKPLERGFAELVTTDLSQSSQLKVLERARIQALLDEINLQHAAGVDTGTGVRAGKMLQAGRLVGGTISQLGTDQLRADAFVTNVQTTQTVGNGSSDQEAADQLFTLEKNVVLNLFTQLGVTLTTAERNAIEQRQTRSLAAFLAYSRGLELQDAGRFDDAGRYFDNAVRIDPTFGAAQQKSAESKSAAAGSQVSASTVESSLRGTSEGATASNQTATGTSTAGSALAAADGLNPSPAAGATSGAGSTTTQPTKDAASGTGGDNPTTKTAKVTIVIHQPGTP